MRIYMHGTLSTPQETFIPETLFFANKDVDDNTIPAENCICLECIECECSVKGLEWSSRWKGVTLISDVDYDEDYDLHENVIKPIRENNLMLSNMDAFFDTDVNVKVDSIMILDGDWGSEIYLEDMFGIDFLSEEIEFIA